MTDWGTAVLSGLFTGIGVILAQRIVAFFDRHPLVIRLKEKADDFTGQQRRRR